MLLEERDYFTDRVVLQDPYDYFAELFSKDPIYQPKLRDVMFVTGFEEANAILRNTRDFSSVIAVTGAAVPLPFNPAGDDISEQLERHRHEVSGSDILVTYDGPRHTADRALLTSLFVPSRLKANQAYMEELAEEKPPSDSILEHLARHFVGYVQDRRAHPRADVLTLLANAKYPDGTTPGL